MAATPQPHQHLTKGGFAYAELRRRILDGKLAPGERLQLRPLAASLGLSVMPVRDALRMLERDGLVAMESHRGARVAPLRAGDILDTIGIRMWLEVLAVHEAVPRHDAASLAAVQGRLEDAEQALTTGDPLAYARANRALHEAIEAPAPSRAVALIAELWNRLWVARRRLSLFALRPGSAADAQHEHAALVRAVAAGDVDASAAAMLDHRASTLGAWREALDALGPEQAAPGPE